MPLCPIGPAETKSTLSRVHAEDRLYAHLLRTLAGDFSFYGQLAAEDLGRLTTAPYVPQ